MKIPNKPYLYSEWGVEEGTASWYCPGAYPGNTAWMHWEMDYLLNRWPANMRGACYFGGLDTADTTKRGFTLEYQNALKDPRFIHGPLDWNNLDSLLYTESASTVANAKAGPM